MKENMFDGTRAPVSQNDFPCRNIGGTVRCFINSLINNSINNIFVGPSSAVAAIT